MGLGLINFFSQEEQLNGDEVSLKGTGWILRAFNEVGTARCQRNAQFSLFCIGDIFKTLRLCHTRDRAMTFTQDTSDMSKDI